MKDNTTLPTPVNPGTARPVSPGLTARLLWCALGWFALNGSDWKSWLVGGPVVVLAALLGRSLPASRGRFRLRWAGVPAFLGFFLVESVRGAWDVSRRVLAPRPAINPGFVHHTLAIPYGPLRRLFTNLVSLLPGTLSAQLVDNRVVIHALDREAEVATGLRELERRVQNLIREAREDAP